jgi:hypothetical protein
MEICHIRPFYEAISPKLLLPSYRSQAIAPRHFFFFESNGENSIAKKEYTPLQNRAKRTQLAKFKFYPPDNTNLKTYLTT